MNNERGSITIFAAVMAVAFLAAAGLALDGGRKMGALAEARYEAANAARAGAQALDTDSFRAAGTPVVDGSAAVGAAQAYLAGAGHSGRVTTSGNTVTVTVTLRVQPRFLPTTMTVSSTQSASALSGPGAP